MRHDRIRCLLACAALLGLWPAVASAQTAASWGFDRCSTASLAARISAARPDSHASYGFDARACPWTTDLEDLVPPAASTGGWGGFALRGTAGLIAAGTTDDDEVTTWGVGPSLLFSLGDSARRWRVTASYASVLDESTGADVVTAASSSVRTDRHNGTLRVDARIGSARVTLDGSVSAFPGSLGGTGGVSVALEHLAGPRARFEPTIGYHLGLDRLGRQGTPWAVFSRDITTHLLDAGTAVDLTSSTRLFAGATLATQDGDTTLAGRHIALFPKNVAPQLPRGASPELIAQQRVNIAPFEQLPRSRQRFALLERIEHRFSTAALRLDERLYIDGWGVTASTTEIRTWHAVTPDFQAGPRVRLDVQTGADLWRRAYAATLTPTGWRFSAYRTSDDSLGPSLEAAVGGALRYRIARYFSIDLEAEATYRELLDSLYRTHRWGFSSTAAVEMRVD